jgi:2-polyprenyl-3-methyl-5-hydroxy-6-metoxy-1,4-benzoquinol methylase
MESMTMSSAAKTADFPCRLCAGEDLEFYYHQGNDGRFRYYRCANCGLVNLDLSAGLDQTQYTDQWVDPTDATEPRNRDNDATFRFIQRYVRGPGRLLDLGCGHGRLLYRAKMDGWEVKGVELSAETAARAQAELGVPVVAVDFLQMTPAQEDLEHFDLVCLRHVLEHLPDSKLAMRKIRAMLAPQGQVLLEMPNIEAWDKRIKRWIVNRGLHRRQFADDFVAGHCNEFCRRSFEYLAEQTGFHLVRWETYSKKPLSNLLYNRFPIGNKARALIQLKGP